VAWPKKQTGLANRGAEVPDHRNPCTHISFHIGSTN